jgi:hypothetical protein
VRVRVFSFESSSNGIELKSIDEVSSERVAFLCVLVVERQDLTQSLQS